MSTSITNSFIAMYVADVHEAYQQRGSKLRNTVRLKTNITGATAVFQKNGKGAAGKKTRHGNVPLMNVDHSTVTATLEDWYGADYVDKLDELKSNTDERLVVANAGAYALGRKIDELILAKLDQTANVVAEDGKGLTKAKILEAFAQLNSRDVPDDGSRFAVVGAHQWNELLDISEFKSADFAGDRYPWLKGTESRTWLGITWMFHTGLPLVSGTRKCFLYHRNAVGLAEGQDVKVFTDWVPEKAAHLVDHLLSAGACLIDEDGVVEIDCDDDAALAA
ncbi:MAG: phage capsid protein [Humidesulfovibrio sp.]|uniref:phage capsid protein n=1 Tax=Humidesulfovibrio sp. TaxID=2910988 RepID=UPI0027F6461D|nr:phage capsid protein [Humidesulfovibrio sp.]MDQ7836784.1 phage capsid protein [Humidesulfovibrio sp.]